MFCSSIFLPHIHQILLCFFFITLFYDLTFWPKIYLLQNQNNFISTSFPNIKAGSLEFLLPGPNHGLSDRRRRKWQNDSLTYFSLAFIVLGFVRSGKWRCSRRVLKKGSVSKPLPPHPPPLSPPLLRSPPPKRWTLLRRCSAHPISENNRIAN